MKNQENCSQYQGKFFWTLAGMPQYIVYIYLGRVKKSRDMLGASRRGLKVVRSFWVFDVVSFAGVNKL